MSEQTSAPTVADSTYWDDPAKSPKRVSGAVVPNADQVLFDVAVQVLTAHAVTGQRLRMDVPAVQCVCDHDALMPEQATPSTVEQAAHKEAVQRAHSLWPGTDTEAWSARLAYTPVFVAGASWHADQMPTAHDVAEVLCEPSQHYWQLTNAATYCGSCLEQAQQVVALWAGDARD